MSDKPRYVVDSSVLVAAALFKGSTPDQAVRTAVRSGQLMFSEQTAEEIREVLARPKFNRYVSMSLRRRFLAALLHTAVCVEVEPAFRICRDPRDDKFLDLAVGGMASFLVTGDGDLLVLNPFRGIPIVTPAEFLARICS
jgi:uncharacterized protein